MAKTNTSSKTWGGVKKSAILIAAAMFVLLATYLYKHNEPFSRVVAQTISHQPEQYTDLYFNNVATLPSNAATTPKSFSFVITNKQGQTHSYTYHVLVQSENSIREISQQTIILNNNSSKTIPATFSMPTPGQTARVIVKIDQPAQEINFKVQS